MFMKALGGGETMDESLARTHNTTRKKLFRDQFLGTK